ncbi:MAG: dTDP-4-dehydrorhamnose reductase [Bacteroidales bacterium]|nr:dTDP-4-dehydrorhamnose reductase [Bacteroidales bacterium]
MTTVLVTGANGQLGSELKILSKTNNDLKFIFTDIDELNITDIRALKNFFNNSEKIHFLINAAAYTMVDKAEKEKKIASKVNVEGVNNLAKICTNYKIHLIHISSDYVFDGNTNIPYNEESPTNPINYYGQTKLESETEALRNNDTIIIRTSWLYSEFGNNFVKTILKKAQQTDTINVVIDQIGTPTYALDLAEVIIKIITYSIENKTFKRGIYNYSNEGLCSWFDFAYEIINYFNLPCKVIPILSSEYPTPAKRPSYSVLSKNKIKETFKIDIPHWRTSLYRCLEKININEL